MLWQRLELDLPQGSWQPVWGGVSEEKGRRGETNGEGLRRSQGWRRDWGGCRQVPPHHRDWAVPTWSLPLADCTPCDFSLPSVTLPLVLLPSQPEEAG